MRPTTNRRLSHYTSRAGLEGIAHSGALWATNFLTVNDLVEYRYAWDQIQAEAFRYVVGQLPAGVLKEGAGPDIAEATGVLRELYRLLHSEDGYGQLYITSFAVSSNEEDERRGLLTHWDRYTGLEGYCLQFDEAQLQRILELDAEKSTYRWWDLADVAYGIGEQDQRFRELARQLGEHVLLHMAQQPGGGRIRPDHRNRWVPIKLAEALLSYCGTHKDPAFKDEREVRILAYPLNRAEARDFYGLAFRKEIHVGPGGKKHIVIGDIWRPGVSPRRIIVGPHADPDIDAIVRLFHEPPVVARCDIPARNR